MCHTNAEIWSSPCALDAFGRLWTPLDAFALESCDSPSLQVRIPAIGRHLAAELSSVGVGALAFRLGF
eukprot:Skav224279  [mRNA]  locus=scaffold1019:1359:4199:+ [translate_table: standard]